MCLDDNLNTCRRCECDKDSELTLPMRVNMRLWVFNEQ